MGACAPYTASGYHFGGPSYIPPADCPQGFAPPYLGAPYLQPAWAGFLQPSPPSGCANHAAPMLGDLAGDPQGLPEVGYRTIQS